MKKLTLLFIFVSSISIHGKSTLPTFENVSSQVCIVCKRPLSMGEIIIIQMFASQQESESQYICEKCRKEEKGRGDDDTLVSVPRPSYSRPSHPPVLADAFYFIVRPSPFPGYRTQEEELKEFEKKSRIFKGYLSQKYICARLPNGYGVQVKRGSVLRVFLLHKPEQEKPSIVGLPLDRWEDNGKGEIKKTAREIKEVIPLDDKFLFIPKQDQSPKTPAITYFYYPEIDKFERVGADRGHDPRGQETGLLREISKFDYAVAQQHGLLPD